MGVAEIAELLQLSRQRVHIIVKTDPSFPTPRAQLVAGLIWNRSDVEKWVKATGRRTT
jgi:predicted DNA-binding transcriptional regulator AlpA